MKPSLKYLLLFSFVLVGLIWICVFTLPDFDLHIVSCDVGQGDATLIFRGSTQILIDGGPDNKVLNCLSKYMPFWDHNIEMVVLTHPETDHFIGLVEVFKRYSVQYFLANSVDSSTSTYQLLKKEVGSMATKVVNPRVGGQIKIDNINFIVASPDEHTQVTSGGFNDFSILLRLVYKSFTGLFTGDIEFNNTKQILDRNLVGNVNFLKVPHHGSKNGLTQEYLDIINPKVAFISVGVKNRYGHPNPGVVQMLKDKGVTTKRTDIDHYPEIVTDGDRFWLK